MTAKREQRGEKPRSLDLHGVSMDRVPARLEQFLHMARQDGQRQIEIITGRGWGNSSGTPVLRGHVEKWLKTNEDRFEIIQKQKTSGGGALLVTLKGR